MDLLGASEQALGALSKSQIAQNTTETADTSAFKATSIDMLKGLIADSPLRGNNAKDMKTKTLVASEPAEEMYHHDYLDARAAQCGILVLHDDYGSGKSAVANIVARARTAKQPAKFLVVSPGTAAKNGDEWFKEIALALKLPKANPRRLSEIVHAAFKGAQKTNDQYRLDVAGFKGGDSDFKPGDKGCDGVLVLEDLNPEDLEDRPGILRWWDEKMYHYFVRDRDTLGNAFTFLKFLAKAFSDSNYLVLVTTKLRRVARTLHLDINGKTKCKLAPSLSDPKYDATGCCTVSDFDYDKYQRGFGWNADNKMSLVFRLYPNAVLQAEHEDALKKLASNGNVSVRTLCEKAEAFDREYTREENETKKEPKKDNLRAALKDLFPFSL